MALRAGVRTVQRMQLRTTRAFTSIEIAVVLFCLALLSGTVVIAFGGGETQATDRAAQANADATLDAMLAVAGRGGDVGSPSRIMAEIPELNLLASTTAASDTDEVSIAWIDDSVPGGPVIGVAAYADDGSCWLSRLALEPTAVELKRLYTISFAGSSTACTGLAALTTDTPAPTPGVGLSWRNPVVQR